MFRISFKIALVVVAAALLSACASGKKISGDGAMMPQQTAGTGRIIVYRPGSLVGIMLQPEVQINGRPSGTCIADGVSIHDVAPGTHRVAVSETDLWQKASNVTVNVGAGQEVYIECAIGFGVVQGRASVRQVPASTGQKAIQGMSLVPAR